MTIPSREPEVIYAGDTVKWTKSISSDYPPATWTLAYDLVNSGGQIQITASDNGDGLFLVNESAATTAAYTAGEYAWQSHVTKAAERYTIERGRLEIKSDFATQSTGLDTRSTIKITLDQIEETLKDQSAANVQSYSIGGRSLSRMTLTELLELREKYKRWYQQEVDAERIAAGLGTKARVLTRFVSP